jgi:hypothetical protein
MNAFDTLKRLLTSSPILGYADSTLPYELHTDASGFGLGAVLYQEQQGEKRVICYASRGLTKAEKNYPSPQYHSLRSFFFPLFFFPVGIGIRSVNGLLI